MAAWAGTTRPSSLSEADVHDGQVAHEVQLLHDEVADVRPQPLLEFTAQLTLVGDGRVDRHELAPTLREESGVVCDVHDEDQHGAHRRRQVEGPGMKPSHETQREGDEVVAMEVVTDGGSLPG